MTEFETGGYATYEGTPGYLYGANGYNRVHFERGSTVYITRTTANKLLVKNIAEDGEPLGYSAWIEKKYFQGAEKPPKPETLLERMKPEDGIDALDPRLDYIWLATAEFAKQKGYCNVYDEIMLGLGLPGRPKNFTVEIDLGVPGVSSRTTVSARSKAEARKIVAQQLLDAGSSAKVIGNDED